MRCQGLWSRGPGGGGMCPTNSVRKKKCLVPPPPSNLKVSSPVLGCSLEIYMIAHDRRIAENTASDHQRLYGNTFQPSGDQAIVSDYMKILFSDRERSYVSVIRAIRRSWAIMWKLGSTIVHFLQTSPLFQSVESIFKAHFRHWIFPCVQRNT